MAPKSKKSSKSGQGSSLTGTAQNKKRKGKSNMEPYPMVRVFSSQAQEERYASLASRKIPCYTKAIDWDVLEQLRVHEEIEDTFMGCGLSYVMHWAPLSYLEPMLEFLSSLSISKVVVGEEGAEEEEDDGDAVMLWTFRLGNRDHSFTEENLREIFGFPLEYVTVGQVCPDSLARFWREISRQNWGEKTLKSSLIKDHHWRLIHRFIVSFFNERMDGLGDVTIEDLTFMYRMECGVTQNYVDYLGQKFLKCSSLKGKAKGLIGGGWVTKLVEHIGFSLDHMAPLETKIFFDRVHLVNAGIVTDRDPINFRTGREHSPSPPPPAPAVANEPPAAAQPDTVPPSLQQFMAAQESYAI